MRRLGRKGQVVKWAGLVSSLLLLLLLVSSFRWVLIGSRIATCFNGTKLAVAMQIECGNGCIRACRFASYPDEHALRWEWDVLRYSPNRALLPAMWSLPTQRGFILPLWLPFLVVVMLTAILWSRDRRGILPDRCQHCGCDLTGNVSGVCSECGAAVPDHASASPGDGVH
jgi:hypothetical protein